MKVSISVGGRFHAFDLASVLEKNGVLLELVTSYPAFTARPFGIPSGKVKSVLIKELIERASRKFLKREFPKPVTAWLFDRIASFRLSKKADIYIIWSSYALYSFRRIRKKNPEAILILERGSSHIAVQNQLLLKAGVRRPVYPSVIRKETQEYHMADFIALPGVFSRRTFIEMGVSEQKLQVNPYGVDLSKFPMKAGTEKTEVFTVGYVGSLSGRKNIRGLIEACRQLVSGGRKLRLLLVGGVDPATFEKQELAGLPWVEYPGPQPQNDLFRFYHQMDVFVLNSVEDGFGMVILQALSCGVPVIGTVNTGAPDVIREGENGFVIPAEESQCLAEKLRFLYDHPQILPDMRKNARKSVETGFSWNEYGIRYLNFLAGIKKIES